MTETNPKPIRLILIRHGESQANEDLEIYRDLANAAMNLTPKGWQQAVECGAFLKKYLSAHPPQGKVYLWHSSYMRARQTAQGIYEELRDMISDTREEDGLIEQSFGLMDGRQRTELGSLFPENGERHAIYEQSDALYFYKNPQGESTAEVSQRCKIIFDNIHRAHAEGVTDFIIVTHGVTLRAFVKEWLRLRREDYEINPGNCDIRLIDQMQDFGYIYKDGQEQKPQLTEHAADRFFFESGAYYPPGATRPDFIPSQQLESETLQ